MLQTKRQTFAKEFLVDRNATQAAIRTGYSVRTAKQQGSRLLTYVDVQEEIAKLEHEQRKVEKVDREYVIAGLRELAENAESEAARVRSLELLGKSLRMFVEVTESTFTHDVEELRQFSVGDLLAMLEQARSVEDDTVVAEVRMIESGDTVSS